MTTQLNFRPGTLDDLPAIRNCISAAYTPYIAIIGKEPAAMQTDFAPYITRGELLVATIDDQLVGLMVTVDGGDYLELRSVAVAPSFQRRSIGRRMMARAEQQARTLGYHTLRLYTNAKLEGLIAMYARMGFVEQLRRTDGGFDRVFMSKALDGEAKPAAEIRTARPSEHLAINQLAIEAWQVLRDGYSVDQWETLLKAIGAMSKIADSGEILVALQGDELVGAVGYLPIGSSNPALFPSDWPSMRMLVVRPSSRGTGIGRRLAERCVSRARSDGARCIGLHTSPIMTVALPMYRRMGFVKHANLPPIAGAPYERHVLWF